MVGGGARPLGEVLGSLECRVLLGCSCDPRLQALGHQSMVLSWQLAGWVSLGGPLPHPKVLQRKQNTAPAPARPEEAK